MDIITHLRYSAVNGCDFGGVTVVLTYTKLATANKNHLAKVSIVANKIHNAQLQTRCLSCRFSTDGPVLV